MISCGCEGFFFITISFHALPFAKIFSLRLYYIFILYNITDAILYPFGHLWYAIMELPLANMGCYSPYILFFIIKELPQGMSWSCTRYQFSQLMVEIFFVATSTFCRSYIRTPNPMNNSNSKKNQVKIDKPIQRQYKDICDDVILNLFTSFNVLMWHLWCCCRKTFNFHCEQCEVKCDYWQKLDIF